MGGNIAGQNLTPVQDCSVESSLSHTVEELLLRMQFSSERLTVLQRSLTDCTISCYF